VRITICFSAVGFFRYKSEVFFISFRTNEKSITSLEFAPKDLITDGKMKSKFRNRKMKVDKENLIF
jgi:hypothetical protein